MSSAPVVVGAGTRITGALSSRPLRRTVAFLLPFVFWEIAARLADNRLLPAPAEVLASLWEGLTSGQILDNAQVTLLHGFTGFAIALVLGVALGVLMARSRWAEAMFQPLLAASYAVPKLALLPLLILALGFGPGPKIVMVALECAYPVTYNTYSGIQSIDKHYFWLASNVGASRWQTFTVMVRAATPAILAGVRMAVPIALVIIVITELIGESVGLGFMIRQAGTDFQPQEALAIIFLLAIIGFVLDRVIVMLNRVLAPWARGVEL